MFVEMFNEQLMEEFKGSAPVFFNYIKDHFPVHLGEGAKKQLIDLKWEINGRSLSGFMSYKTIQHHQLLGDAEESNDWVEDFGENLGEDDAPHLRSI